MMKQNEVSVAKVPFLNRMAFSGFLNVGGQTSWAELVQGGCDNHMTRTVWSMGSFTGTVWAPVLQNLVIPCLVGTA